MDNFDRHWRNINKTEKNGEKLGKLFFSTMDIQQLRRGQNLAVIGTHLNDHHDQVVEKSKVFPTNSNIKILCFTLLNIFFIVNSSLFTRFFCDLVHEAYRSIVPTLTKITSFGERDRVVLIFVVSLPLGTKHAVSICFVTLPLSGYLFFLCILVYTRYRNSGRVYIVKRGAVATFVLNYLFNIFYPAIHIVLFHACVVLTVVLACRFIVLAMFT